MELACAAGESRHSRSPLGKCNYRLRKVRVLLGQLGGSLVVVLELVPAEVKEQGLALMAVNYRLFPKVKRPVYIEAAAAAVAWTFKNIEPFGGDPNLILVFGHSARGYLTSMVGLDKRYSDQQVLLIA